MSEDLVSNLDFQPKKNGSLGKTGRVAAWKAAEQDKERKGVGQKLART